MSSRAVRNSSLAGLGALIVIAAIAWVRLAGQPVSPPDGILARLDCSPENFPACGWEPWGNLPGRPVDFRARLLPRGGPQSQDAVEFTQLAGPHRQYYLGWGTKTRGAEPEGVTRYIRTRIWVPGPAGKKRGYHGAWSAKFLILGDGGDALGRVICNLRDDGMTADTMSIECGRNIDGEDHSTGLQPLTLGAWHSIQIEARSGPTATIAIWIDTNDYARPTSRTRGRFSLLSEQWKFLGVGFFATAGGEGPPRDLEVLRIADDVELAASFDPTWHR